MGLGAAGVIVVLVLAFIFLKGGDEGTAEGTAGSGTLTSSAAATSSSATTTENEEPAASSGPCPDTSIAVKATVERPTYKVGDEPVFGIVITNISTQACERDFGSDQQQVLVYSLDGTQRIWSNIDCFPDPDPKVKILQPGKQEVSSVKWSGQSSTPNCEGERLDVEPGAYSVVAQLGTLRSVPEPFNVA